MTQGLEADARAYDETPYTGDPLPEAQPDRLAAVAALHGLAPAPPAGARVLELGCGDGANLRAAAHAAPGAELVGLDLSGGHVAAGARAAAELGLTNLRLVRGDLREARGLGAFDYVIAHGVFSWIPPGLQAPLLEAVRGALAPGGVAYVSYNTFPGWCLRGGVHEVLRRQTRGVADPAERFARARALLELLAAEAPAHEPAYRAVLRAEAEYLRAAEVDPAGLRAYLAHEVLAEHNHPVWFDEFAALARAHGLRYVADANLHEAPRPEAAPPAVRAALEAQADPLAREQLADCLTNRHFRRSLLVREGAAPTPPSPSPDGVRGLVALCAARPEGPAGAGEGPAAFARPGGRRLVVDDALGRAALTHLVERYPEAVPFAELLAAARALSAARPRPADDAALARLLLAGAQADVVELRAARPPCVRDVTARPAADPLARRAARLGLPVFNALHQRVRLEPLALAALPLLDGTRDLPALADALAARAAGGGLALDLPGPGDDARALRGRLEPPLRATLRALARSALLSA